jgi:hypothetical protein
MFRHLNFEVEIVRHVEGAKFRWPEPGEATHDSGLGCNRMYAELRRLPWTEAKRVFSLEGELVGRIQSSEDSEAEYEVVEEELSEGEADLLGRPGSRVNSRKSISSPVYTVRQLRSASGAVSGFVIMCVSQLVQTNFKLGGVNFGTFVSPGVLNGHSGGDSK